MARGKSQQDQQRMRRSPAGSGRGLFAKRTGLELNRRAVTAVRGGRLSAAECRQRVQAPHWLGRWQLVGAERACPRHTTVPHRGHIGEDPSQERP